MACHSTRQGRSVCSPSAGPGSRRWNGLHDESRQSGCSITWQIGLHGTLAEFEIFSASSTQMSRVEEGRRLEPLEEVILEVDAEKVGAAHCNNAAVPRWTIVFFGRLLLQSCQPMPPSLVYVSTFSAWLTRSQS